MLIDENAEPKALPLSLLEDITSDFSDDHEIGRGGFAVVYKVYYACHECVVTLDLIKKNDDAMLTPVSDREYLVIVWSL
jgi:hypothetical protein